MLDFIRIGCAVPKVRVGDVKHNVQDVCDFLAKADAEGCDLVIFPELGLTGYTCADLFFQQPLQRAVKEGLDEIVSFSTDHPAVTAVVGLPVLIDGQLYNSAAVIQGGELLGISVKTFVPNYEPVGERRWFAPAEYLCRQSIDPGELGLKLAKTIPVGNDLIFTLGDGVKLGVEICEDLWAPIQPSAMLALNGAEVIVNLAASHELTGKRAERREMVKRQSDALLCIYAFCSAGATESTQDLICSGHSLIAENGVIIGENENTIDTNYLLVRDLDIGILRAERMKNSTFRDAAKQYGRQNPGRVFCGISSTLRADGSRCQLTQSPFLPTDATVHTQWYRDVFEIQVSGLVHRLDTIGAKAVLGVSGGLDSTLALLVAVEAMRRLGRPIADVHGITMPCFGTSDRTFSNASELMCRLGITCRQINIREAVTMHFRDIDHDAQLHDTTYENVQARERTQILMDYAGKVGGIVVGTGDLSELALGWCTYNGDHMSMYSVNSSVPKSLIPGVIKEVSKMSQFNHTAAVLADIIDTPISPELLPPDMNGGISQQTEDIVGPYILHDFFLYYVLRYGFAPRKIFALAVSAFDEVYDKETIKKWLQVFYRRFFSQQFKRNCQPDGIRACVVGLNPRGDWCMPSDASALLWQKEVEDL